MTTANHIDGMLARRLAPPARQWFDASCGEIAGEVDVQRFCALFSMASRHAPRAALAPDADELQIAERLLAGWNPERWSVLDTMRIALVLARPDLEEKRGVDALEEAFRYAEVGELVALYRSLAHLPHAERCLWRAGEGARSSIRLVFEAVCCDTPYPARYFDDVAWRQAIIKCLFIEAPLWRVWHLDARLDAELARMALDLSEERRSAGRPVNPELWMCLGQHGGSRALAALEHELAHGTPRGRASAAIALARAGDLGRLRDLAARESDALVRKHMQSALAGPTDQRAFAALDPDAPKQ
jgi:hypothetical protein